MREDTAAGHGVLSGERCGEEAGVDGFLVVETFAADARHMHVSCRKRQRPGS